MTPEEAIAKGVCPVKPQFIRALVSKTVQEAVTGAGRGADSKSKKKQKRERNESKKTEMCTANLQGTCRYGDQCRFSHDVQAFVHSKPADLPGSCPFLSTGLCAYGISCRWAGSHTFSSPSQDTLVRVLLEMRQNQASLDEAAASTAAAASNRAAATTGAAAVTAADASTGGEVATGATTSTQPAASAAAAATTGAAASTGDAAPTVADASTVHAAAGSQAAADVVKACGVNGLQAGPVDAAAAATEVAVGAEGTLSSELFLLPTVTRVEKTLNSLDKDLQSKLWKSRYDFSRADAVLQSMGLRIAHKVGSRNDKSSKAPPGTSSVPPGAADAAAAAPAPANGTQLPADAGVEGVESADQPALKRPKMEASSHPGPAPSLVAHQGAAEEASASAQLRETDPAATLVVLPPPAVAGAVDAGAGVAAATVPTGFVAGVEAAAAEAAKLGAGLRADVAVCDERADLRAMHVETPLRPCEKKVIDFIGKTYLAPLTTVGNLPFRRVCKGLGADITCGEMAMATSLLQGQVSEWALLKRHPCEDVFGVQICGGYPDALARTAQLIEENLSVDFVDVNMGCPIDIVCDRSAGSSLLLRPKKIEDIARAMSRSMSCPLTLKTRKGYYDGSDMAHTFIPQVRSWGAVALTLHGRTRQQRYSRQADWDYVAKCAELAPDLQLIGNGDVFSFEDWNAHMGAPGGLSTCMIARGALVKPWIFTEIKEQRHWDISAGERLDLLKQFCTNGLEHWGSDSRGVENTRRFLLEWLSYLCRYVPVGLLEVVPQQLHWWLPPLIGRNDLETLLSSNSAADWVRISEMLLGPVPEGFSFSPKHKTSSYTAGSGPGQGEGRGEQQAEG